MDMEKRPGSDPPRRRHRHGERDPDNFFGFDADAMSPKAQVTTSLAVLVPVVVAGAAVLTLFASFCGSFSCSGGRSSRLSGY